MIDWILINDSEGNCEKDIDQFIFKLANKKIIKKTLFQENQLII